MLFSTLVFFIFLAVSLIIYYLTPPRYRSYSLLAVSIFFYIYSGPVFIFFIAGMTLLNYFIGITLGRPTTDKIHKIILISGICINVGALVFFKYWNFLIANIAELFSLFHVDLSYWRLNLLIPLGLSYYVFQFIGYLIDIYWKHQKAEKKFLHFSLFIMFFPKIPVGPIERARNFLPQLKHNIFFEYENLSEGGKRIVWGLFKKLVVADRIAIYQSAVMSTIDQQSATTIIFASVLYTFQVYADFSGYTDIALGTARLFGYNLMENFQRPFLSKNIGEFWRRWHISLSSWVNDYVFTPLAFKKRKWGIWGVYVSLVISFAIIGIWHGPTWNYLLFGLLQALALIYEYTTRRFRKRMSKTIPPALYNNVSILLMFLYISFCLIIFRTETFGQAFGIIKAMFTHSGTFFYNKPSTLFFILIGCSVMLLYDIQAEFKLLRFSAFSNKRWIVQQVSYALLIIYILLAGVFDGGQFIYLAF